MEINVFQWFSLFLSCLYAYMPYMYECWEEDSNFELDIIASYMHSKLCEQPASKKELTKPNFDPLKKNTQTISNYFWLWDICETSLQPVAWEFKYKTIENPWFSQYDSTLGGHNFSSRTSWEKKWTKLENLRDEIFRLRLFPAPSEHSFPFKKWFKNPLFSEFSESAMCPSLICVYIRETGLLRTVEIELAIARTFVAAHLKDELLNFQNLQKNQKSVTRNFF